MDAVIMLMAGAGSFVLVLLLLTVSMLAAFALWEGLTCFRSRRKRLNKSIFISYRRSGGTSAADHLKAELERHLGRGSVYLDRVDLIGSADWQRDIESSLSQARALIAIIGPTWESGLESDPRRSEEDDWVRREIALALRQGTTVRPVLVGRTDMPLADALPPELRGLLSVQAFLVHPAPHYERDVATIARSLRASVGAPSRRYCLGVVAGAVLLGALSTLGLVGMSSSAQRKHDEERAALILGALRARGAAGVEERARQNLETIISESGITSNPEMLRAILFAETRVAAWRIDLALHGRARLDASNFAVLEGRLPKLSALARGLLAKWFNPDEIASLADAAERAYGTENRRAAVTYLTFYVDDATESQRAALLPVLTETDLSAARWAVTFDYLREKSASGRSPDSIDWPAILERYRERVRGVRRGIQQELTDAQFAAFEQKEAKEGMAVVALNLPVYLDHVLKLSPLGRRLVEEFLQSSD